jgi:hypothetical protein
MLAEHCLAASADSQSETSLHKENLKSKTDIRMMFIMMRKDVECPTYRTY